MRIAHALSASIGLCLALATVTAEEIASSNWPQFRGPGGNSVATAQSIPTEFGPAKNLRWRIALGTGNSSPCIWDDRIFVTAHESGTLKMICLRRSDGRQLWIHERRVASIKPYEHVAGSPANSTPVTDGKRVVFQFDDYGLVTMDVDGKVLWEKPFTPTANPFSYGASPILDDGRVYINRDGAIDSSLLCLDLTTGNEQWRAARPTRSLSWCTPYILREGAAKQVLVGGSGFLDAYDAREGTLTWSVGTLPKVVCPSPVAGDGMVVFGGWTTAHVAGRSRVESVFEEDSGVSPAAMKDPKAFFEQFDTNKDGVLTVDEFPKSRAKDAFNFIDKNKNQKVEMAEWAPVYTEQGTAPGRNVVLAIAPGGTGNVTASHVRWEVSKGLPYVASPVIHQGRVYLVKTGGFLTCLDLQSGKPYYESERLGVAGEYYATPVVVGNHIVVCAQRGSAILVESSNQFRVISRNELGESLSATPAVAHNTLFIRGERSLWAFGK